MRILSSLRRARIEMRILALALIVFMVASGQQPATRVPPPIPTNAPGTNATAAGTATFSSTLNLVTEEVTVVDKSGKSIDNLTAKDFVVTEDGVPQTVSFLQYQNIPDDIGPALQTRPETPSAVAPLEKLTTTEIAPEAPGQVAHRDRRLLVVYFDMTAMPQSDQLRALSAAEKFVHSQMSPADLMCIMKYDGAAVEVLSDFTDDRDKLLSIIETIEVGEGQGFGETSSDAASSSDSNQFGQDDSEFNLFTTDRQLAALQTAAKMLGTLNEKKVMVIFASGINLNGIDNQAQLHATENTAIKANVSFWPVDARGLVAMPPMGDGTQRTASGNGMFTGATMNAYTTRLQSSQDTLWTLAADTGGKALLDNNDLGRGIINAEKSIGSYYILGYNTTNSNLDGKFRKIKITLNNALLTAKDYRQGYYGNKVWNKFNTADKERQLEDALLAPDPLTEITIAMELDFFQLNRAEYQVPMMVKIPGREVALAKRGGAERTVIDFVGEVKDDFGTTVSNIRDKAEIKVSDSTAAELAKRPIEYTDMFTLLPGGYTIKFLARDNETGRVGTYISKFVVPNLMKPEENVRVPISSVVLSSQRVDLKDALFNALKDKDKAEASNPMVVDGQKLIPSVTRVFSKTKDMYVFLQAYEAMLDMPRPVVASVAFYQGQNKVFETPMIQATTPGTARSKPMGLRFTVPLTDVKPGLYNCQVTVLDPEGQRASFWEAPIEVIN
jgi:VWFA-related protein